MLYYLNLLRTEDNSGIPLISAILKVCTLCNIPSVSGHGTSHITKSHQTCEWKSLQKIPARDLWVFPAEAPDPKWQRHGTAAVPSLNSWPTGPKGIIKKRSFYATKFGAVFMQQWTTGTIKSNCGSFAYQTEECKFHRAGQWFSNSGPQRPLSGLEEGGAGKKRQSSAIHFYPIYVPSK